MFDYNSILQNSPNYADLFKQLSATGNAQTGYSVPMDLSAMFGSTGATQTGTSLSADIYKTLFNTGSGAVSGASTSLFATSTAALSSSMTGTVGNFSSNVALEELSNYSQWLTSPSVATQDGGSITTSTGFGRGVTTQAGNLFGYLGGTSAAPSMDYKVPIYSDRVEQKPVYNVREYQAWDYDFQVGQSIHQTSDTSDTKVESINRDPVIFDLDYDGELGVTGKDSSQRRANETSTSTSDVSTSGNTRTTTTNTHKEWDLLVDWDNKIDFDVDGDGTQDRTEWVKEGTGDGFMVLDADGDGQINGRELMNETGIDGEKNKYANGWEKARDLFDTDNDGILKGDELKNVSVWVDSNGDGVTDSGELKSMEELGFLQIDTNKGSFTRQELAGYETVHTREQIGYSENYAYAGMNEFGVGTRTIINGEVVSDYHLG